MPRVAGVFGLWFGWVFFVVYGSLLPFDFRPMALDRAVESFYRMPFLQLGLESRADWIANGVLYLPVGLLTARLLFAAFAGRARFVVMVLALAFGALLACGIEFSQLFFPPRTVSRNDLMAEGIGTVIGVVLALFADTWASRLRAAWGLGGPRLLLRLLEAYVLAYLLLALFPFDLLLSASEWRGKMASDAWGWWLAGSSLERGWLVAVLLGIEVLLALPLGVLLAARRPARRRRLAGALILGCLVGLSIELGQFAIASGISQGLSVLTRGLGLALGVWGWQWWGRHGVESARQSLGRLALVLAPVYLALLIVVNGWFTYRWQGPDAAATQWAELRLIPFYYHYYTTEALAMFSLGSVAVMYLPVALIGWARKWATDLICTLAALLALSVEASKLILQGLRPDPTNLLIAVAACWLALWLLKLIESPGMLAHGASGSGAAAPDAAPAQQGMRTAGPGWILTGPALAVAFVSAWFMPLLAWLVLAVLVLCAVLTWRWPMLALFLVPAALPAFDLAPWTGRFFWNEFDMLLLVVLALAWHRTPPPRRNAANGLVSAQALVLGLLGISLLVGMLHGLSPWNWPDLNSFNNYYSGFNAVRIAKGAVWAGAFIALYRRLEHAGTDSLRVFAWGMSAGLLSTVAVVVWERLAFVGVFDFDAMYRVTGPFSAMHIGGAIIETYLAVATAFLLWLIIGTRSLLLRLSGAILLALATYALMVTYSRNGYAAMLVVVLVSVAAVLRRPGKTGGSGVRARRLTALVLALLVAASAWPVLQGSFAPQRLAKIGADQATRLAHWRDALQLQEDHWATTWFGAGLGRFPALHYWRSGAPLRAASYGLASGKEGHHLRLGTGASVYVEQFAATRPGQSYTLSLDVRASQSARLGVALCEKWMLTSANCHFERVDVAAAPGWRKATATMSTQGWPERAWFRTRPVKLALFTQGGPGVIDVDNVTLQTAGGPSLLANGDFSRGLDHWFFSADHAPAWQVDSLPITLLLELGWFGLLAWGLAVVTAIWRATARVWRGDTPSVPVLAALLAVLVSGSQNTLINDPRLLMLIVCMMAWCCADPAKVLARRARALPADLPAKSG